MSNACVVFLIEESPSMHMRIAEGSHTKLESIATAVNSAIRQMEGRPSMDVAVIGCHRNAAGEDVIGSRFGGKFAGRTWISSEDLTAEPWEVEVRTKQIVNPVTRAVTPMTVDFPIWFKPQLGVARMEYSKVFSYLAQILQEWMDSVKPAAVPLIFNFIGDMQPGNSIANAVVPLGQVSTAHGFPFLFQFHSGTYANVPAIKYPTVPDFLPYGPVQELFFSCSILNESMHQSLRQSQEYAAPGAKALIYNGRMIDMVRMLGVLKIHQELLPQNGPPALHRPQTQVSDSGSVPVQPPVSAPVSVPAQPPVSAPVSVPAQPPVSAPVSVPAQPPVSAPGSVPAQPPVSAPGSVPAQPPVSAPGSVPAQPPVPSSMDAGFPNVPSAEKDGESIGNSESHGTDEAFPAEGTDLDVPPSIKPLPPRSSFVRKPLTPCEKRISLPNVLSTDSANFIFEDFENPEEKDHSLDDIPSVGSLPEIKAEIIPHGMEICCRPLPTNKPTVEPETLPPRQTLLILLVDRSVSDLMYKPAIETWKRRVEKVRFMLGEVARRGRGRYDVSLVFYGKNADGEMTVESGTLGRSFLSDKCLVEAAGNVEQMTIQIPNGIGGLLALPRKKLSFTECSPTYPADPTVGFQRITEIVREWDAVRQNKILPPVILHITSGKFLTEKLDDAMNCLWQDDLPPISLLHWVFTERPHAGVCCPSDASFSTDESLQALWERTDPLPAREFLAGVRPGIHEESRGMMVNMDFDVLFEVLDTQANKCARSKK